MTAGALASENSSLLGSYSSEDVTAVTTTASPESAASGETTATGEPAVNQAGLSIWPIVGTCVGAVLLVLLLVTRRRGNQDASEGRRG